MEGKCNELFCLMFDCSEQVMEQRLLKRGETSGRSDDNIESIRKRFQTYVGQTVPILDMFAARDKLKKVCADPGIEEVWANVKEIFAQV